MARFLFVAPPLVGHVKPMLPLGRELQERDHAVAWVGYPELAERLPSSATFLPVAESLPPELVAAADPGGPRGLGRYKGVWEQFFIPLSRHMLGGVEAAVDAFGPDVVVTDQQVVAGGAVAERRGIRWATSASTPVELTDPLAGFPPLKTWLSAQLHDFLLEAGLDAGRAGSLDPLFSPDLVLGFTTPEILGRPALPTHTALVGPFIDRQPPDCPFPWDWLEGDRPVVLVTLGTINSGEGERFFAVAAEALATNDARGVVVAPPDMVPDTTGDLLVLPKVPQVALLPYLAAVITHAGYNTVCEALAAGLPLVVAPITDDQPFVASQVTRLGAGVRVKFKRVTAPQLGAALGAVLGDLSYRAAARRVGDSFGDAGGPPAAADRLEALASAGIASSP